ncbi:hypothetical protein CWI84_11690 [Idiomarina tyrosinivorans]|uniref:Uncharacterized protein n=1 Tax=Idiomarina tyrosinivorans TaxID=1445662 RepID=A0A432ZEZ3_9GAMM|nr:hypothetical protein [Idiomarina tyrosinivorans]RUO76545.1 hypothetical protein CWI84_11690 [Idiomarina tyrosinivorans]
MLKDTSSFPDEIRGKKVSQVPELSELLEKVSVDGKAWTTLYRCKFSGEEWLEIYEATGHGEIPVIRRKKP